MVAAGVEIITENLEYAADEADADRNLFLIMCKPERAAKCQGIAIFAIMATPHAWSSNKGCHHERLIDAGARTARREKVATGLDNNASEVIREALRLFLTKTSHQPPPVRDEVVKSILRIAARLRSRGVKSLSLFGPVARGDATFESDVDVLIDVEPNAPFSVLDQAGVQIVLENALGHAVDVVLRESLRSEICETALADSVQVF